MLVPTKITMWKFLIVLSLAGVQVSTSCDMDQIREGCRIQNRGCSCGIGCISEYRYASLQECHNALKGKRSDICTPNPCQHGGSCLQISQSPGFRCRCEETGYFGALCNRACPVVGGGRVAERIYPHECIVI